MPLVVKSILVNLITAATVVILAAVIISWLRLGGVRISSYNPLVRGVEQLYQAMMRPLRQVFPMTGGGLDLTPMVALVILSILRAIIRQM